MAKSTQKKAEKYILWFKDISIDDIALVGGKNASLGEMYSNLSKHNIRIPNGFAVTSLSYWAFLKEHGLDKEIKALIKDLDVHNVRTLSATGKKIRDLIMKASFPKEIEADIISAYKTLSKKYKSTGFSVAVRSSATAEDLPNASFAGQQESYLNVRGQKDLLLAVKKCIASLFTDRAISYREANGFGHMDVALSVTVQQMVGSDTGSSGVMFTLDTESGFDGVVLINAAYGLGEYVVKGRVTPDQYYVYKDGVKRGKRSIISRTLGTKEVKLMNGKGGGTKQEKVLKRDQDRFVLSDDDVLTLAKWGMKIEEYYKRPQDIEWAKDGKTGELFIVQARPETVQSRKNRAVIEQYELKGESKQVLTGIAIGKKIGSGKVRIIDSPKQMKQFQRGDVLVTKITDPDWEPIMRIASAIVTEQGGKTSHAAIVSREIGVPAIVGAEKARKVLKEGHVVTVDCTKGDEGRVFKGKLPFEVHHVELKKVTKTKTKIMMNIGDPDHAFDLSFLPNDGIGLARLEFIFNTFIKIHPLALVHYSKLKDKKAKAIIKEMTRGYRKKTDYCVDRLADGIARLAAAYKGDVIVRLSDFKTNEYATMIGGKEFEPDEQNPMIGWRGASRYYSKEYKPAFQLECEAIKRVREEWGLDNVVVMLPFCRTPEEGEMVLKTMKEFGLEKGKNGLRVYVMCEIPSNVILAEEFAKIFDGFSIGSNDLTQLTLGVDRDSSKMSDLYDARNPAVKKLVRDVIGVAKKHKKYVGICGQAPSDYPDFAEFLVREGVDSISLNPDTVVETRARIAYVEKTVGKTGKKTNTKMLSLIAGLAMIGASLIGIGAGCGNASTDVSLSQELSPAAIREAAEQKVLQEKEDEYAGEMATLFVDDFADFEVSYPVGWSLHQWRGGVTLKDLKTGEYVTIAEQLVSPPYANQPSSPVTVAGISANQYQTTLSNNQNIFIVSLPYQQGYIEISGQSEAFQKILSSITFVSTTSPTIDDGRPLNEWDIKEGRLCAQVVTYAREGSGDQCVAFPTPCDVPDGWSVCEGS